MPSTWSLSLRFELQGTGENLNTWGVRLNSALQRIDKAIAGAVPVVTAGGSYTLSTANGLDDEARAAILLVSGTGGTIVVPSVSKLYTVRNGAAGAVTVTTGAGASAIVQPGEVVQLMCDGAAVTRPKQSDMGGLRLSSLADPASNQDAATKAYVDGVAWSYNAGNLPGLGASAGKFLKSTGVTATWATPTASDIPDLAAELDRRRFLFKELI